MESRLSDNSNESDEEFGRSDDEQNSSIFRQINGSLSRMHKRKYSGSSDGYSEEKRICLDLERNQNSTDLEHKTHIAWDRGFSTESKKFDSSSEDDPANESYKNDNIKAEIKEIKSEESKPPQSYAEKLLMKMGYEKGKGLGKNLQGINEPVAASRQKGRRGLGLELPEIEQACIEFDEKEEVVKIEEDIQWLANYHSSQLTSKEMTDWIGLGQKLESVEGETLFCEEDIVKGVLSSKSVFDKLDKFEMRDARTRSNPFETIRSAFFLNRAAVKMANIDKACDFMFTNPQGLSPNELLYFADVCAGPGGFSEYVLWRKKWRAKGFGFTLKNENDFKLHDFQAGTCETFHPYYGPAEDGDVYKSENQIALRKLIMSQTNNKGVHFMMSDGGFSYDGQENLQEILSKQLYLCQCLIALMIVRTNGHFVTKLFDLFTPFSAGLVYIMYRCFDHISIFKPNTSRPANSERYLICKGKRPDTEDVVNYLFEANKQLLKNDAANDVLEIVSLKKLIEEENFFNYLKSSNDEIGKRQIVGLKKIAAYAEDKTLIEKRQKIMRENCLAHWELPDKPRLISRKITPSTHARNLLSNNMTIFNKIPNKEITKLSKTNINKCFLSTLDWVCQVSCVGENEDDKAATLYLGQGRSSVFKYDILRSTWEQVVDLELPPDTLVYGEIVSEFRKENRSQSKIFALHIMDACFLGSENISNKHFTERHKLIELFAESLWKPSDRRMPIRVKDCYHFNRELFNSLSLSEKVMKNRQPAPSYIPHRRHYENDCEEQYYCVPKSIVLFKTVEEPWACHFSKSKQINYYYNRKDKTSLWNLEPSMTVSFARTLQTRIIWNMSNDNNDLSQEEFNRFLSDKY